MTEAGKRALIELEGLKLAVYLDSAGLPTIGVGHLLTKDELSSGSVRIAGAPVDYRSGLTHEQCIALMEADLAAPSRAVQELVHPALTGNQFDALTLFAFNIGIHAFTASTLLQRLNQGDIAGVPDEMRRWNHAGGKVVQGLINRREAEIRLWIA